MSWVFLFALCLSLPSILSAPIFPRDLLRPLYPFIHAATHSHTRVKPHHHVKYRPAPPAYAPPPAAPTSYAPPPKPAPYEPAPYVETSYEPAPPKPTSYEPTPIEPATYEPVNEPEPYEPSAPEPSPPKPSASSESLIALTEDQDSKIRFASFDVSLTGDQQPATEPELAPSQEPTPIPTQAPTTTTQTPVTEKRLAETTTTPPTTTTPAPTQPPTTTVLPLATTTATPISVEEVVDIRAAIIIDDAIISEADISEVPIEIILEMAKDPKAEGHILEMAVEKIKEVQEFNDQSEEEQTDDIKPEDLPDISEVPLEIILDMATDPEAGEQILEMAVMKIKEVQKQIEDEPLDDIKTDDVPDISEVPLAIILEMAKDPEAGEQILEMAVEKIKEVQKSIEDEPTDDSKPDNLIDISEVPLEIILEMAKDPQAEEIILEMAVEKIQEVQDIKDQSEVESIEDIEPKALPDISEVPLEIILEMAKDPNAGEQILEMAVEKIKEVQAEIEDEATGDRKPDNLPGISEVSLEIILDMAKDPKANENILEMAIEKIQEVQEINDQSEVELTDDTESKLLPDISEVPLEILLEMAKDPNAGGQLLEMAVAKIKEVQELDDQIEDEPTEDIKPDNLVDISEMPIEIILDLAKDPKANEHILEMAVEKIQEVQEINDQIDVESSDDIEPETSPDISEVPLEVILGMAKDPKAGVQILEMAVEKIIEVQKLNDQVEDEQIAAIEPKNLPDISEVPLEIILDMAKDPNAGEQILEMAVEKIKEVADQIEDKTIDDNKPDDIPNIYEVPLEIILDMAKDPKAEVQILEMAMEKIKEVQKLNDLNEAEPDVQLSLARALPMEILLELAKDPEAKKHILAMAVERLKELQELNEELEEGLVALEPIVVEGTYVVADEKNFDKIVIVEFPDTDVPKLY